MPVRSLNTSVLRWPNRAEVERAARAWAVRAAVAHRELLRLGYFGSYARGDWGVGSDLDLLIVVRHCDKPIETRALDWDLTPFPVPVQAVIYTEAEWRRLQAEAGRFIRTLEAETVWLLA